MKTDNRNRINHSNITTFTLSTNKAITPLSLTAGNSLTQRESTPMQADIINAFFRGSKYRALSPTNILVFKTKGCEVEGCEEKELSYDSHIVRYTGKWDELKALKPYPHVKLGGYQIEAGGKFLCPKHFISFYIKDKMGFR